MDKDKVFLNGIAQLKEHNSDSWSENWQIIDIGDVVLSADVINERSQDFKNTRKASDV